MSSSYRMELDKWLSNLEIVADTVYDVGGSQLSIMGRIKLLDCKKLVTFDLPQPHKDSDAPDVEMDLNDPEAYVHLRELSETADVIFCLEVFDYIYDPMTALENLAYLLKEKGRLFVTFPTIYPLHQPVEDDALRYMPGGIKKLAQEAGLKIVSMTPRHFETNWWAQTIAAERMRGAKHEDHSISGYIVEFTR